jgi:hypothetical protein
MTRDKLTLGLAGACIGIILYLLLATSGGLHGGSGWNGTTQDYIQYGVLCAP